MSALSSMGERVREQLASMTPRERTLLMVMGAVMLSGVLAIIGWTAQQKLTALHDENHQRRQVMEELRERRADFAVLAAERERIEERLSGTEVRLSSFIESMVNEFGIARPSEYTDRQVPRDNGIIVLETIAEFDRLSLGDVDELMNAIDRSEELVFIQALSVAPARRAQNGELTVELNLVTFKRARGNRD